MQPTASKMRSSSSSGKVLSLSHGTALLLSSSIGISDIKVSIRDRADEVSMREVLRNFRCEHVEMA